MVDDAKVAELMKDETVQAVASLEPVPLDPKKLATDALEAAGGDLDTAREKMVELVQNTDYK